VKRAPRGAKGVICCPVFGIFITWVMGTWACATAHTISIKLNARKEFQFIPLSFLQSIRFGDSYRAWPSLRRTVNARAANPPNICNAAAGSGTGAITA